MAKFICAFREAIHGILNYKPGIPSKSSFSDALLSLLITCGAKLLSADWLRQRAFFLNREAVFGN